MSDSAEKLTKGEAVEEITKRYAPMDEYENDTIPIRRFRNEVKDIISRIQPDNDALIEKIKAEIEREKILLRMAEKNDETGELRQNRQAQIDLLESFLKSEGS